MSKIIIAEPFAHPGEIDYFALSQFTGVDRKVLHQAYLEAARNLKHDTGLTEITLPGGEGGFNYLLLRNLLEDSETTITLPELLLEHHGISPLAPPSDQTMITIAIRSQRFNMISTAGEQWRRYAEYCHAVHALYSRLFSTWTSLDGLRVYGNGIMFRFRGEFKPAS